MKNNPVVATANEINKDIRSKVEQAREHLQKSRGRAEMADEVAREIRMITMAMKDTLSTPEVSEYLSNPDEAKQLILTWISRCVTATTKSLSESRSSALRAEGILTAMEDTERTIAKYAAVAQAKDDNKEEAIKDGSIKDGEHVGDPKRRPAGVRPAKPKRTKTPAKKKAVAKKAKPKKNEPKNKRRSST